MTQKLADAVVSRVRAKARIWMLSITMSAAALLGGQTAQAATHNHPRHVHYLIHHGHVERYRAHHYALTSTHHYYESYRRRHHVYYGYRVVSDYHYRHTRYWTHYRHSGLQCVPYAREVSHIDLSGDAFLWWAEASGRYARGDVPEEGAVLNFRGIGRMPLGHVAVVTSVIDSRTILVTQANWVRGTITNDVQMQDVSPNNDWTQVQVELGDSSTWGAAYPTYGFIYNRPATSTIIAANGQGNEVAEAPTAAAISLDAPNRNLQ